MSRLPGKIAILPLLLGFFLSASSTTAQAQKPTPAAPTGSAPTTEKALALAERGHCREAVPALKLAMASKAPPETRKQAGVAGLRCSLNLNNHDSTLEFVRLLNKQFPEDPDVLFILVHAYSDLSSRTAQDLGRIAPQSIPAHKLYAEALEMQGKWDDAQREYETILEKQPNMPGIHFLLGRSLLSRPEVDAKTIERAKQEFQKELEIDPKNAAAHYVLGELDSKEENWEDAIVQFSEAAKLDANFAEAYLGWGFSLVTLKRYEEAIPPLRLAERLAPGNPAVHYSLATALSRTGQKEEADKEFAIHRRLTATTPAAPATEKPQ